MAHQPVIRSISLTSALRRDADALRPEHPPIERVAADLRRLRRTAETLPVGASFVRTIGVLHAYDYVLTVACEQLEVPTRLMQLPDGKPRILERLRLEFLLGECGLRF